MIPSGEWATGVGILKLVSVPPVVKWPMVVGTLDWVNHKAPSSPAVISIGNEFAASGNSVTVCAWAVAGTAAAIADARTIAPGSDLMIKLHLAGDPGEVGGVASIRLFVIIYEDTMAARI